MISLGWRRPPAAGEAGAVQSSPNSPAKGGWADEGSRAAGRFGKTNQHHVRASVP